METKIGCHCRIAILPTQIGSRLHIYRRVLLALPQLQ
jgi:hypothetical protein